MPGGDTAGEEDLAERISAYRISTKKGRLDYQEEYEKVKEEMKKIKQQNYEFKLKLEELQLEVDMFQQKSCKCTASIYVWVSEIYPLCTIIILKRNIFRSVRTRPI